jgi:hypothetical protein
MPILNVEVPKLSIQMPKRFQGTSALTRVAERGIHRAESDAVKRAYV